MSGGHKRRVQPNEGEGLWVTSDATPDGSGYMVTISADGDTSWVLDRDGALEYARTCVEAAQRAEYDAAIARLFIRKLKTEPKLAAEVLARDVRPDRPPLNDAATHPLQLIPGVNAALKPFITMNLNGKPWGQLDTPQLREHAMIVLEAPAAVDLDAGLLRCLLNMGIEEPVARAAVSEIVYWRD